MKNANNSEEPPKTYFVALNTTQGLRFLSVVTPSGDYQFCSKRESSLRFDRRPEFLGRKEFRSLIDSGRIAVLEESLHPDERTGITTAPPAIMALLFLSATLLLLAPLTLSHSQASRDSWELQETVSPASGGTDRNISTGNQNINQ